ncbi:MAG: hypothetical protein K5750_05835 [Eubacterium sp.]|nr:hypothetical protein [Eubacterium sp.]
MRKKIMAGAMILTLMLASGCGKDEEQSGVKKIERTSIVATVATTEATTGAVSTEDQPSTADISDTGSTDTTAASTEATTTSGTEASTASTAQATTEASTNNLTTSSTEAGSTEATTSSTGSAQLETIDISTESKMRDYLHGVWRMVPSGNPNSTNPGSAILWDKGSNFIELTRDDNDVYIYAYTKFDGLFGDGKDITNYFELQIDYASGSDTNIVDSRANIQIMTTVCARGKIFAIRETGNGESAFAAYGLDYERTAWDYMWVFKYTGDAGDDASQDNNIVLSKQQSDSLLKKGQSFYAFKWFDSGDQVILQPVDVTETTDDWYGEELHALSYVMSKEANSIYAPTYDIKGAESLANSGGYAPCLCYVTTDSDGKITEIKNFSYLGYGYYNADKTY